MNRPGAVQSHLIGSQRDFGIVNDDYEKFLGRRSSAIADALNEILNPEL
jgi:hypothetical protein